MVTLSLGLGLGLGLNNDSDDDVDSLPASSGGCATFDNSKLRYRRYIRDVTRGKSRRKRWIDEECPVMEQNQCPEG